MGYAIAINDLMETSGVKFGTSGARGLVADMTDRVCYAYTLGFIKYLKSSWVQHNSGLTIECIALAGDLRPSTTRIMQAVARAAIEEGLQVINCGAIPSSAVALYGLEEKMPAVMVTGSHIPADRNGIKYNTAVGEILKEDEAGIKEQVVDIGDIFDVNGAFIDNISLSPVDNTARINYIQRWLNVFPSNFLAGLRLGIYEHSAVGRDILKEIYAKLGADVIGFERSDIFVPVDTEAVRVEDIELAKKVALEKNLDAILSTDGDSDRPLISDEKGEWLRGDIAGIFTAEFLQADCVVTPVSSNTAVELCGKFDIVKRSRIGSPFVITILQQLYDEDNKRIVVGYEANGGFLQMSPLIISGKRLLPLPTRDPVIVHLAVLGLAKKFGMKISELLSLLPKRVGRSDRLQGVATQISSNNIAGLIAGGTEAMEEFLPELGVISSVDTTDGLRMTFESSDILHIRPSGNAPELRCYVEAATDERADWLLNYGLEAVKNWL